MRLAVPLVLAQDLAASPHQITSFADNESSVYRSGATEALRTTVQPAANGIALDAAISSVATQRNLHTFPQSAHGAGLLTELDSLAKEVDGSATAFSTKNENALKFFTVAVSTTDPQLKVQHLKDAVAADASFGLAYIALAETLATTNGGDPGEILKAGQQHLGSFTPLDKAHFEVIRSQLLHAPLAEQIQASEALIQVAPNDPDALATLASGLFLAGRAPEAERIMSRALEIAPENATLRQNLATGLIQNKQFAQAEKVLSSLPASPQVLPQIAFCALLAGDAKRADSIFTKFLESIGNPNARTFLAASWQADQGNLPAAISQLRAASFNDPRLTALSKSQLVLWQLMAKRFADAKATAADASPTAALLASGAPSADAWLKKVDVVPDVKARDSLKAYGLFLYGFYADSAAIWKTIVQNSGGSDLRARAMLAASLKLAGQPAEAAKLPVQPFLPDFNDYYGALSFGALRSALAQAG